MIVSAIIDAMHPGLKMQICNAMCLMQMPTVQHMIHPCLSTSKRWDCDPYSHKLH